MSNNQYKVVRQNALISIYHAGSGHPGGVLSSIDVISELFYNIMNYDKNNWSSNHRDRFILSKGHCAPALYAVASEIGIIEKRKLKGLRKINNELQGHTHRGSTVWTEASTGSLGQGFSFALGEALGLRLQKISNTVYVMLGDGELQEGEVWEAAMFAGHHRLDNICAIVDYNKIQSDDFNRNIIGIEPLNMKWESFNWNVIEIDGHNIKEIKNSFKDAKKIKGKPTVIISNTIKGKGVSFMEGVPSWHGSLELSYEDTFLALLELGMGKEKIKENLEKS